MSQVDHIYYSNMGRVWGRESRDCGKCRYNTLIKTTFGFWTFENLNANRIY